MSSDAATARASVVVASMREARSSRRTRPVRGQRATDEPDRLTTASARSMTIWSSRPVRGSHSEASDDGSSVRTSRVTWWPCSRRWATRAVPRKPEAPPMTTCMPADQDPSSASKRPVLETLLDGREEATGIGAVDDAVVVGEREVGHAAHRDALAAPVVGHDDRTLDDGADAQDRDLRLVDDRRVEQRAVAAEVRDRERRRRRARRARSCWCGCARRRRRSCGRDRRSTGHRRRGSSGRAGRARCRRPRRGAHRRGR